MNKGLPVLGIDLVGTTFHRSESGFVAVPDAFEKLSLLGGRFGGRIHCISTVPDEATREVFENFVKTSKFTIATDIPARHIHFCVPDSSRERTSEKNFLCANHGVTHFVDANVQSLCALSFVRRWFWLDFKGSARSITLPESVTTAFSWDELLRLCDPARE